MIKKDLLLSILAGAVILTVIHLYINAGVTEQNSKDGAEINGLVATEDTLTIRLDEFGIPVDSFIVVEGRIRRNQTLSTILSGYNISSSVIHSIANHPREILDARRIRSGDGYKVYFPDGNREIPHYFIYKPNQVEFVKIHLNDTVYLEKGAREVKRVLKQVSGTVSSSLWNSMLENNVSPVLAIELSEIYAWSIDFFGLRQGDSFKAYYHENYIDTNSIGIDQIEAALFIHMGREFYAIPFEQDSVLSFFDQDGNSLRRAFLKAPLRYSRISSGFSHSRMHPIYRVRRPHRGVDYAAPTGTPIYAIGDGRVTETSYGSGSGNMLRIRHNGVYTSGYMHLRNFASGIKPNVWVKQGDVIGYVGSTGASTGPHLDFRIWRNGHPVDPLSIESPPVEPIKEENISAFERVRDLWIDQLDRL
jgi:murein DD-endopeptidase MepM/ murein hydrolase activator NlpD